MANGRHLAARWNRTGLTAAEAKQLHAMVLRGLALWVGISLFVHLLAWAWMPWLAG